MSASKLAVDGGTPVRAEPWPSRSLIGIEERNAVNALFDEAIRSGNAPGYNGPTETAYCEEFAEFMGGGYADAVNSGTSAVYVALRALEIEPFTEVIVGTITDPGGIMPIPLLNCIPVVADVTANSFNTGPDQIAPLISPLTSAIVVAHIAGEPADIEGIMALGRKHRIPVVEDCAQAHCARLNGSMLGTFGDVSAFSTMFGKHHCTGGQGGVVFTRDEKLYQKIRWASDRGKPFGCEPGARNQIASLNLNLNDFAAAIGRVQLRKLPDIVARRRAIVAGLGTGISDLTTVKFPELVPGAEASYWFLRLQFVPEAATCDKTAYLAALSAEGLPGVNGGYGAVTPHKFDWARNRRVFGTSEYPWSSPEYKGNPDREFPCPNAAKVNETAFNMSVCETWGNNEIDDMIRIFEKVDAVFGR